MRRVLVHQQLHGFYFHSYFQYVFWLTFVLAYFIFLYWCWFSVEWLYIRLNCHSFVVHCLNSCLLTVMVAVLKTDHLFGFLLCQFMTSCPRVQQRGFSRYNNLVFPSIFAVLNILYHAESERTGVCLKQSLNKFCWHEATAHVMFGKLLTGEDTHSCVWNIKIQIHMALHYILKVLRHLEWFLEASVSIGLWYSCVVHQLAVFRGKILIPLFSGRCGWIFEIKHR